jgi:hypothetical protein
MTGPQPLFWNLITLQTLHRLWREGHSASAIAKQLSCSRSAVQSKLHRLGLHRQHKVQIVKSPTRKGRPPYTLHQLNRTAIVRKAHKISMPLQFTRTELREMLAEAAANTARM